MSARVLEVRSVLKTVLDIDPGNWSAFYVDAYINPRNSLIKPKRELPLGVKQNAVEMLNKRLASRYAPQRDVVGVGCLDEPFPLQESKQRLTRGLLESLYKHGFPLYLKSSSFDLLQHMDLLTRYTEDYQVHLCVPLSLNSLAYKRIYREGFDDGLTLIKELKKALPKAHISAMFLPLYPSLHNKEDLDESVRQLKYHGADSVRYTLCDNLEHKHMQNFIDTFMDNEVLLEKLEQVHGLIINDAGQVESGLKLSEHETATFKENFMSTLQKYQLTTTSKRFLPLDYRYSNYDIAQRLFFRAEQCEEAEAKEIRQIAYEIQSLTHAVKEDELLDYCYHQKVKRDIAYFLSTHTLACYGQAHFF